MSTTSTTTTSTTESVSDISLGTGNVSLKVLGKSGNFQIANGAKYILFKLDRLQEVDSGGKRVQLVNPQIFKSALSWGPVTPNVVIPGSTVAASMVQLNASFALGKIGGSPGGKGKPTSSTPAPAMISFVLSVYIATASGTYTYADATFPVNANDVKYTIEVSNWPFASSTNKLQFGLAMQTDTTDTAGTNTIKTKSDVTSASVAVGGAVIETPLLAIIDDTVSTNVLTSTYGNGTGIQFTFPSFAKSLVYDPTVDTSGNRDTSSFSSSTADSSGTTVVGGDASLVTPDTTYNGQFNIFLVLCLLVAVGVIALAVVLLLPRLQRNITSITQRR
jgi:hypothetical protein